MLLPNAFGLLDAIDGHFCSYRRYFSIEISHLQMAIYTSRREEMISVVRSTLRYLNADEPIQIHSLSPLSSPYQVFSFKFMNFNPKVRVNCFTYWFLQTKIFGSFVRDICASF